MRRQICNSCGKALRPWETGHIFECKVVCPQCIKLLDPKDAKPKIHYGKIAIEAIDRATEQTAKARVINEDHRYEKAKRRCVFFMSSVIWLLQLILAFVFLLMLPAIFLFVAVIVRLFGV